MILDEPPKSRQELYERIQRTSKDAVVLEEMIRHGFWPERGVLPQDPAEEVHRRAELEKRLGELRSQLTLVRNEAALRAELRRKRMEESKRRQAETRERRKRERAERAERWKARRDGEIVYLGEGVSSGLSHVETDEAALARRGLPRLRSAGELAAAAGLTIGQLRFLAFSRKVSRTSHYVDFKIAKKSGGERLISAPKPRLKKLQRWILEAILERVALHGAAHGFRHERSILTNAAPHAGALAVVNLDLEDFFPSIRYPRVKGLFRWLGYSEQVATVLALVTTTPRQDAVLLDGTRWFVATGPRALPQGAPTSPAITNILCERLDRRLASAGGKLGFAYTRYADDLTFSAKPAPPGTPAPDVGKLLRRARFLVAADGLRVHPRKTRVLRRGRRQEVTGLVVNERPAVPRDELRRFRAVLFQIEKDGPSGKTWGPCSDVLSSIEGFANYVAMVTPGKGKSLKARVAAIHAKHGYVRPTPPPKPSPPPAAPPSPPSPSPPSGGPPDEPGERKTKPWWKFW